MVHFPVSIYPILRTVTACPRTALLWRGTVDVSVWCGDRVIWYSVWMYTPLCLFNHYNWCRSLQEAKRFKQSRAWAKRLQWCRLYFQIHFREWKLSRWFKFHLSFFPRVQLIISRHYFREWLGAEYATSQYLKQSWPQCTDTLWDG